MVNSFIYNEFIIIAATGRDGLYVQHKVLPTNSPKTTEGTFDHRHLSYVYPIV